MLGTNGTGKTTTIECTIGLKKFDGGSIRVLGIDPSKERKQMYGRIGVQLQETSFKTKLRFVKFAPCLSLFIEIHIHMRS